MDVSFDPMHPETITISYPGIETFTAEPIKIGSFSDKKPEIPISMLPEPPEKSRFLLGLEKRHQSSKQMKTNAISFNSYRKEEIFTEKALSDIHREARGIPRRINRICEKTLMYACQQGHRLVDEHMVKYVLDHEMLGDS